jgi:POTRA domain, FtsQ-type
MSGRGSSRQERRRRRGGRGESLRRRAAALTSAVAAHPRGAIFFLLAGAAFFTVGPVLRYCMEHRYFAVRAVEIHGVERLDAAQVRVWLGMVEGSSIWTASPRELEARLEAQPSIARAAVRRILPDRLQVVVREREPRALLRYGSKTFLVDRAGEVIGSAPLHGGDLPIITLVSSLPVASPPRAEAPPPAPLARGRARRRSAAAPARPIVVRPAAQEGWMPAARQLRQAVAVARLLEQGHAGIAISELNLAPGASPAEAPELVAYSTDGRLTIELGWGDWEEKLEAVRRVLAHEAGGRSVDRLAGRLDVRDPSTVVARWADGGAI